MQDDRDLECGGAVAVVLLLLLLLVPAALMCSVFPARDGFKLIPAARRGGALYLSCVIVVGAPPAR